MQQRGCHCCAVHGDVEDGCCRNGLLQKRRCCRNGAPHMRSATLLLCERRSEAYDAVTLVEVLLAFDNTTRASRLTLSALQR